MKLSLEEIKKLEKITKIIEDKGKRTNTGYQVEEILYHYGSFAKLMEKTDVDVDNDFLENNLLYTIIDNEIYKVINEDIEDL